MLFRRPAITDPERRADYLHKKTKRKEKEKKKRKNCTVHTIPIQLQKPLQNF